MPSEKVISTAVLIIAADTREQCNWPLFSIPGQEWSFQEVSCKHFLTTVFNTSMNLYYFLTDLALEVLFRDLA